MKIKKKYLKSIMEALNYKIKSFAEARKRDSIAKEIATEFQQFIKDEKTIFEVYCKRDKKGNVIATSDGMYQFKSEDREKINKELDVLYNEDTKIEFTPELKKSIENSTAEFDIGITNILDELITNGNKTTTPSAKNRRS